MLSEKEYLIQLLQNPAQINELPNRSEKYLIQLFFHLYLKKDVKKIIESGFFDTLEPKEFGDVIKELKKQLTIDSLEKNDAVVQLFALIEKNDSSTDELKRNLILTQILPALHDIRLDEIKDEPSASLKARLVQDMHKTATFEACMQNQANFSRTYKGARKAVQQSFVESIAAAHTAIGNHDVKNYVRAIKTADFIATYCKDILVENNVQTVSATKTHFTHTANLLARNAAIALHDLFVKDTTDIAKVLKFFADIKSEAPEIYNYTHITKREVSGFKEGIFSAIVNYFMRIEPEINQLLQQDTPEAFAQVVAILTNINSLLSLELDLIKTLEKSYKTIESRVNVYLDRKKEMAILALASAESYHILAVAMRILALDSTPSNRFVSVRTAIEDRALSLAKEIGSRAAHDFKLKYAYTDLQTIKQLTTACGQAVDTLEETQNKATQEFISNVHLRLDGFVQSFTVATAQSMHASNADLSTLSALLMYIDDCSMIEDATVKEKLREVSGSLEVFFTETFRLYNEAISSSFKKLDAEGEGITQAELMSAANTIKLSLNKFQVFSIPGTRLTIKDGHYQKYFASQPQTYIKQHITIFEHYHVRLLETLGSLSTLTPSIEKIKQLAALLKRAKALSLIDNLTVFSTFITAEKQVHSAFMESVQTVLATMPALLAVDNFKDIEEIFANLERISKDLSSDTALDGAIKFYRTIVNQKISDISVRFLANSNPPVYINAKTANLDLFGEKVFAYYQILCDRQPEPPLPASAPELSLGQAVKSGAGLLNYMTTAANSLAEQIVAVPAAPTNTYTLYYIIPKARLCLPITIANDVLDKLVLKTVATHTQSNRNGNWHWHTSLTTLNIFSTIKEIPISLDFSKLSTLLALWKNIEAADPAGTDPLYSSARIQLRMFIVQQINMFFHKMHLLEPEIVIEKIAYYTNNILPNLPETIQSEVAAHIKAHEGDTTKTTLALANELRAKTAITDMPTLLSAMKESHQAFRFAQAIRYQQVVDNSLVQKISTLEPILLTKLKQTNGFVAALTELEPLFASFMRYQAAVNFCMQELHVLVGQHFSTLTQFISPAHDALEALLIKLNNKCVVPLSNAKDTFTLDDLSDAVAYLEAIVSLKKRSNDHYVQLSKLMSNVSPVVGAAVLDKFTECYAEKQRKFALQLSKKEINDNLVELMNELQNADAILQRAKSSSTTMLDIGNLGRREVDFDLFGADKSNRLRDLKLFKDIKHDFESAIKIWRQDILKDWLKASELQDVGNPAKRKTFYQQLVSTCEFLKGVQGVMNTSKAAGISYSRTIYDDTLVLLKARIAEIADHLLKLMQPSLAPENYAIFNMWSENLIICKESFSELNSIKDDITSQQGRVERRLAEILSSKKVTGLANLHISTPGKDPLDIVVERLIELQTMKMAMPHHQLLITTCIAEMLTALNEENPATIKDLGQKLTNHDNIAAKKLIESNLHFAGLALFLRNKAMSRVDVTVILDELEGEYPVNKAALRKDYDSFDRTYKSLIKMGLEDEGLITRLPILIRNVSHLKEDKDKIKYFLAHLFAYWTLENSEHYKEVLRNEALKDFKDKHLYLLHPHPAQVLALLRMFETDKNVPAIDNDMAVSNNSNQTTDENMASNAFWGLTSAVASLLPTAVTATVTQVASVVSSMMSSSSSSFSSSSSSFNISNNILQVGTGEGKSVILAMTVSILALMGKRIDCACYSTELSQRDYKAFEQMFKAFVLDKSIQYDIYQELSEKRINHRFDVRDKLESMLRGTSNTDTVSASSADYLLIDEFDYFYNPDFYVNAYQPTTFLQEPAIKDLIDAMWQLVTRSGLSVNQIYFNASQLKLAAVKKMSAYNKCCAQFPEWNKLIDVMITNMLKDLKSVTSASYVKDYVIKNNPRNNLNEILYISHDGVSSNEIRGYKTLWSYYLERYVHVNPDITESEIASKVGFYIKSGQFSYAEMIKMYEHISGVSGTLKDLIVNQGDLLKQSCRKENHTFVPSAYGNKNKRFKFDPATNFQVVPDTAHFAYISAEINRVITQEQRAILIFFESEKELNAYYNSNEFKKYKNKAVVITESMDEVTRKNNIEYAAIRGKITLATRAYSRGTDYVSSDAVLDQRGGLHVLSTVIPPSPEDQTQMEGRTARQGNHGSFSMIVPVSALKPYGGIMNIPTNAQRYQKLIEIRAQLCRNKFVAYTDELEKIVEAHRKANEFLQNLETNQPAAVQDYLVELNTVGMTRQFRTVILLDTTGSMGNLVELSKKAIDTIFTRVRCILSDAGREENIFELQVVGYKHYNSPPVLEISPSTNDAQELSKFLNQLHASGGSSWGNEAIEVAFQLLNYFVTEANGELSKTPAQVIIMGDAPPNTREHTNNARVYEIIDNDNTSFVNNLLRTPAYFYSNPGQKDGELDKFVETKIPVQAVYLNNEAKSSFEYMAKATGGKAQYLGLGTSTSDADLEKVIKIVAENILFSVGGEQLAARYEASYVRNTSATASMVRATVSSSSSSSNNNNNASSSAYSSSSSSYLYTSKQ